MKSDDKYRKVLKEAYTKLYAASEPSADFNELLDKAPWVNEKRDIVYQADEVSDEQAVSEGLVKYIDYEKYFIDVKTYSDIMDEVCKKYNLSKREGGDLRMFVALFGPTPTFKDIEDD